MISFFSFASVGDIGNASKMNLIMNLILGTTMAGLAEGMALADRAGLLQKDLLEILQQSSLSCPIFMEKGKGLSGFHLLLFFFFTSPF